MKRFPFPLRFSIPAILVLFSSLLGFLSFEQEISETYSRTEENARHDARFSGNQISGMLEYLYRREDSEQAEIVISKMGSDPRLRLALLCDENNRVILATRYELRNHPVIDTPAANSLPAFSEIREKRSGRVMLSQDRQRLRAMYPVLLGAGLGENRVGILLIEYDLSNQKNQAYADALERSLKSIVMFAGSCIAIWFFFDKTLTSRAAQLVAASNSLAKGILDVRTKLQGSDELAHISVAFDRMADRIQAYTEALQASEERFRSLVSNISGIIYRAVYNRDWRMEFVSDAIAEISGYPPTDFIDNQVRTFASIIHPEDRAMVKKSIETSLLDRQPYTIEYRIIRVDGSVRWVYEKGQGIPSQNGDILWLDGAIFDISDRKQVEAQRQLAKEAAEAASLAKSEFLARMSHELRTPLNAILGFTQIMNRDTSFNPQHREYLDIINRSGQHLLALINDILEMSKIEAGRVMLNENHFDLYRLLDSLEDMLRLKATAKYLTLTFNRTPDVPQYITTDESKLRQVLLNLLSNAIKFTQVGSVMLRVRREDGETGKWEDKDNIPLTVSPPDSRLPTPDSLVFEVEDTGLGIAIEEMNSLFDAFVQTETGRRSQEGTGLGLPISRKFVQLMGGDITVNSVVGQGSIFAFNILVNRAEAIDVQTQQPNRRVIALAPDQPVYRLLIVEDTWEHRQLLLRLLLPLGFEVQAAENGQEGVELWKSWEPHLIWMDMRMPVMDGYEATKKIKVTTKGQATVIIALTASAFEDERSIILSAGCDDFVSKPFREEEIFERLTKHLGVRYIYEESAQVFQKPYLPGRRLTREDLVVMPDEWVQKLYQAASECSDDGIFSVIEQIPAEYTKLATTLSNLAYNFQYEEIIELSQGLEREVDRSC